MKALRHPVVGGLLASLALAAAVTGHRVGAYALPGFERLELWSLDLRFALRGPRAPGPETVILAYDDRTYAADPGLWERRAGWAKVVRAAREAGARVIAIDALFSRAEQLLPAELRDEIAGYVARQPEPSTEAADGLVRRVHGELQGDAELARAFEEAGNVQLILHLGTADGARDRDPAFARARYGQSTLRARPPRQANEVLASLPELNRRSLALGYATVHEDETHTVRQFELARLFEKGVFAPMPVHAVARFLDVPRAQLAYLGALGQVRIGERQVTLDQDDAVWLNFRGPAGSFPTIPVIDLMEGRLPAGALEDKIVLLGMTHLGQDRVRTPFSSAVPGVEIQATLVDNLLRGDPLRRTGWWTDGLLCLLVGLLVSLSFWPRLVASPPLQALAALFVVGAYLSTSGWLFAARDLWAPWLGPGLAFALAGAVCLTQSYLGEGRQRRRLRKAFAHYLGDEVIGELLENPRMLAPGGERRELSVLFSDIRDFTTYSERLSPEQIVAFLNTYLTPMTRAVLGTQGYLDKYIGDAIMAVFGAPVPRAEHAPQALDCALRMHRELDTLRPEAARLGIDLRIGVGVNTGEVIVGNMGAEERFDYTVAGDSVNLASRLEGLTKVYGVFCLVGERTRRAAGARFCFREVDLVQVKGKSQPVAIYELLGGGEHPVASYGQLDLFERGVERWRAGAFAEAHAAFLAFLEANPGDPVSRLYLERLDALGRTCPPGWTGVFVHVNK